MEREVEDRFIDTAHLFHLAHDPIYRIEECPDMTCKQNVAVMRKFHIHVPQ